MPENVSPSRTLPWSVRPGARNWRCAPAPAGIRDFHSSLPDYAPTPLAEQPSLAVELGVGRVFVKDESNRLGLPAFKALGASWAVHRTLAERAANGGRPGPVDLWVRMVVLPRGAVVGAVGSGDPCCCVSSFRCRAAVPLAYR